jgi:hypothetical protein
LKLLSSIALLTLACSYVAGAVAQTTASDAEKKGTVEAYMNCLVPYAKRLDDGRSDAQTIAKAMSGACSKESEAVGEILSRGESEDVKARVRKGLRSIEEHAALQVVLDNRNSK